MTYFATPCDEAEAMLIDGIKPKPKTVLVISKLNAFFLSILTIYLIYTGNYSWAFASFFGIVYSIAITTILVNKYGLIVPMWLEIIIVTAILIHIFGGVFNFYNILYYDKFAHFFASMVGTIIAVLIIYTINKYNDDITLGPKTVGIAAFLLVMAIGAIWEISEFIVSQLPFENSFWLQHSLADTMIDMLMNLIAGIIVAIVCAISISKGKFESSYDNMCVVELDGKQVKRIMYPDNKSI